MPQDKHVAIIGGGIGGLSAAYFLHGRTSADGRYVYRCSVFEQRDHLGGNALTAYFEEPYQKPFADLGVNDFNLDTYRIMGELLTQLKADGFEVPYARLLDQACFATARDNPAQSISYTTDEMERGNPRKPYLAKIKADWTKFQAMAGEVMKKPKFRDMSVAQFVRDPDVQFSPEFSNYNLLPRINGMYFMGDTVPGALPIRGVMSYYHLQEGLGNRHIKPPDRNYFVRGASQWIDQLANVLRARGVELYLGERPTVIARTPTQLHVQARQAKRIAYDYVVSAVYADEVAQVIVQGLPPLMPTLLAQFRYINSISIAHDDPSVLPPEREQWRTYNILIHRQDAQMLRPYTISYVSKMHQGERTTGSWFVTVGPVVPIPDERVRSRIDPATGKREPAVSYFRHNVVSVASMTAQRYLDALQGHNNIFFTGGWTKGAGLHEEILASSLDVANRIRGYFTVDVSHAYTERDPDYVPKYLRDSFVADREVEVVAPGFWA